MKDVQANLRKCSLWSSTKSKSRVMVQCCEFFHSGSSDCWTTGFTVSIFAAHDLRSCYDNLYELRTLTWISRILEISWYKIYQWTASSSCRGHQLPFIIILVIKLLFSHNIHNSLHDTLLSIPVRVLHRIQPVEKTRFLRRTICRTMPMSTDRSSGAITR